MLSGHHHRSNCGEDEDIAMAPARPAKDAESCRFAWQKAEIYTAGRTPWRNALATTLIDIDDESSRLFLSLVKDPVRKKAVLRPGRRQALP
jgi:hypothetical protein